MPRQLDAHQLESFLKEAECNAAATAAGARAGKGREGMAAREQEADSILDTLERLHRLLFAHPAATQALFQALVLEGRRFIETEQGAQLAQRLTASDQVARARVLWEALSVSAFTPAEAGIPSVVIEEFAKAATTGQLESQLSDAFERSVADSASTFRDSGRE